MRGIPLDFAEAKVTGPVLAAKGTFVHFAIRWSDGSRSPLQRTPEHVLSRFPAPVRAGAGRRHRTRVVGAARQGSLHRRDGGRSPRGRLVVQARFKQREAYILIQVETRAKAQVDFAERMFRYYSRLRERHGLPVYPATVLSNERPVRVAPTRLAEKIAGIDVLNFRFRSMLVENGGDDRRTLAGQVGGPFENFSGRRKNIFSLVMSDQASVRTPLYACLLDHMSTIEQRFPGNMTEC